MVQPYYNTKEAAKILRLTPSTLRNKRCSGKGPKYSKVEGRVLYAERDLLEYLEKGRR